jgi:hypothetical protein
MKPSGLGALGALLLSACVACGGSASDDSQNAGGNGSAASGTGAGGSASGVAGGAGTADYGCPETAACVRHNCDDTPCEWQCQSAPLCDTVAFSDSGADFSAPPTVNDMAAVQCALTALRDGTTGSLEWSTSIVDGGGTQIAISSVDVVAGRVALLGSEHQNLGGAPVNLYSYSLEGPAPLADAPYFTACLAETDPELLRDCFTGAITTCP